MKNVKTFNKGVFSAAFVIIIFSFIIYGCKKEDAIPASINPTIENFLKSETFSRAKNDIEKYGEFDFKNVKVDSIKVRNEWYHFFTVEIKKGDKITATLDVVDLHDTRYLPYNDKYAMNISDLSNFDFETKNGEIRSIDVNYDNFHHSTFNIKDNIIEKRTYKSLTYELSVKFHSIRMPGRNTEQIKTIVASENKISNKAVPCDSNHNGNLGFWECYGCFKEASEVKGTFGEWWCDAPVAGWVSCWTSISAACVILSSIY
ncbi:MAG: hypothetical protein U1C70_09825 [Sediminibacterium sp.]|jgi:major membrane immunogen (membrane-anchored lipoprotein)|uniref:hypothetical protein n=1 Tax=Sediminibacterium sp. TaxID=1917865 RepID=UPI002ABBAC06|nr:hypothetical protein [Sediminibacterium sp.]MDZ4072111.1 hypothetical protein [Sediminibacterium sp.]